MSTMLAGDIILYVDLSKLSNLGTYQEIGKSYDATERNFKQNIFSVMLNSKQKIEQNPLNVNTYNF